MKNHKLFSSNNIYVSAKIPDDEKNSKEDEQTLSKSVNSA